MGDVLGATVMMYDYLMDALGRRVGDVLGDRVGKIGGDGGGQWSPGQGGRQLADAKSLLPIITAALHSCRAG